MLKIVVQFAVLVCAATLAAAQSAYPAKTVRVVIPWPPGGGNDIAGRTVMQRVAESTGQSFPITTAAARAAR